MSMFSSLFGSSENQNEQNSNVGWIALNNLSQLDEIVAQSSEQAVFIFKHSTRCGISRMVLKQFEKDFHHDIEVTPYFLDLLAHRNISNAIAERFGVEHQSPQLLLIKNGKSVYDASHSAIAVKDLEDKL